MRICGLGGGSALGVVLTLGYATDSALDAVLSLDDYSWLSSIGYAIFKAYRLGYNHRVDLSFLRSLRLGGWGFVYRYLRILMYPIGGYGCVG